MVMLMAKQEMRKPLIIADIFTDSHRRTVHHFNLNQVTSVFSL